MPDEKASENELFRRQTTAGTEGQPPLTETERKRIVELNAQRTSRRGIQTGEIPPRINELMKKQSNAGIGSNPDLTPEERRELTEFYASQR